MRSVTVLAHDAATADALTKVVFASPSKSSPVLAAFHARALVLAAGRASIQIPKTER